MSVGYRMVFQSFNTESPDKVIRSTEVLSGQATPPTNCLDFSVDYEDQIEFLKKSLDCILGEKIQQISQLKQCPECSGQLIKTGKQTSIFHDVLTDHDIIIQRIRCIKCKYELPATVRALINTNMSAQLTKIQSELGATHPFRESENILDTFAATNRKINNRNRIKNVANAIGNSIAEIEVEEKELLKVSEADELILNVDGGHVKTTEDQRSIEVLTSVIYRPEALKSNQKHTSNYLESKSCAASVKDDKQEEIINNTIFCAIKQGLTQNTVITALCDGASNCWKVAEALKPLCKEMNCILDWFHIAMKVKNISVPKEYKDKLENVKWHLWRGNVGAAITRLDELIFSDKLKKSLTKLTKFKTYIQNNAKRVVNYLERKDNGQVFTSNLAESTVESLINRRCKGHQHMRWSRDGLNPILQLRSKLHTDDWNHKWKAVVMNTALKTV